VLTEMKIVLLRGSVCSVVKNLTKNFTTETTEGTEKIRTTLHYRGHRAHRGNPKLSHRRGTEDTDESFHYTSKLCAICGLSGEKSEKSAKVMGWRFYNALRSFPFFPNDWDHINR
jgi:hypothetical protein